MPSRLWFLTIASLIAVGVGGTALIAPDLMLASKGIVGNAAAQVWMQEVGALLLAVGVIGWLVRSHQDSATLRALLWGNGLLQLALLPIEVLAHLHGVIPHVAGIVPNTALHALLAVGFVTYARAVRVGH